MWLSKKKYDKMVERIERLEDCHEKHYRYHGITISEENKYACYTHKIPEKVVAHTKKIADVTLQELASYVIDNEPIERKKEITVKFI